MGRPKAHPNLPEYMVKLGAAYKVKRPIPEHAWNEFPELKGKARIKIVSLGPDEKIAKRRFLTEIDAIEERIERAGKKASPAVHATFNAGPRLYTPAEVIDAIGRWARKHIDANLKFGQERELKELHGIEVPFEAFEGRDLIFIRLNSVREMADQIIRRQAGQVKGTHFVLFNASCFEELGEFDSLSAIPDFKQKFADVLKSEDINLHPVALCR